MCSKSAIIHHFRLNQVKKHLFDKFSEALPRACDCYQPINRREQLMKGALYPEGLLYAKLNVSNHLYPDLDESIYFGELFRIGGIECITLRYGRLLK